MTTGPDGSTRIELHPNGDFAKGLAGPGSSVMVGGFGEPGTPFYLLDALACAAVTGLDVIKNDANEPGVGVGQLLRAGSLRSLTTSHIGLNSEMVEAMDRGEVSVEFHPQGILAEKIRCGGSGIPAFLSEIGVGIFDADGDGGRQEIDWNGGRYLLEPALRADVALLHAWRADSYGNLIYRKSARNFNPLMAMAAKRVVVEVEELLSEPIDPEAVHTPGCFVDHLVVVPHGYDPGTRAHRLRRDKPDAG